jgi:hypothetical protein
MVRSSVADVHANDGRPGEFMSVRTPPTCEAAPQPSIQSAQSSKVSASLTVYVADIEGRGIVAFEADNDSDAKRFVRDRAFRDDLMVLATAELPLWDGIADIQVRQARPDEAAKWRASRAKAIRDGNIEGNEDAWIAFLVALTDPDRRKR